MTSSIRSACRVLPCPCSYSRVVGQVFGSFVKQGSEEQCSVPHIAALKLIWTRRVKDSNYKEGFQEATTSVSIALVPH